MSSGRGRSPCDTGPRELRLDVICPGKLAGASRRNDDSAVEARVNVHGGQWWRPTVRRLGQNQRVDALILSRYAYSALSR
jgi:hypothetical protein